MNVVAVVLSVDEAERLETCLPVLGVPALVVDNACTDDTAAVADRHGARVVALPERLSYAAAMNAGLAEARDADAVLIVNADCVLAPGAVAILAERLSKDDALGAVAPKLLRARHPDRIDAAGMHLDRRRKNNIVGHNAPASAFSTEAEVFGPDGACGLWRRSALDDVAPDGEVFDETLALWASDADLAWRARIGGWRSRYVPEATGEHVRFFSPSTRAQVDPEHRRLQFRNRLLMIAKNDRALDLLRAVHHVALYELLAFGYALVAERDLLPAYRDAWRALPETRRRRRAVQQRRRARPPYGLMPPSR